ncbi:hypothetical protein [Nocardia sp. R6R-6]|uniref:hypothetical protein n=1 Tax=Nocardia sp. R6R-6 TaxID=3459303 RepID=UPI00403E1265
MPAELSAVLIVVAAVGGLGIVLFSVLPWILDHAGSRCHTPPLTRYTIPEARLVMQRLIDCDTATCAAKDAAFRTLIDAKLVTPARADR